MSSHPPPPPHYSVPAPHPGQLPSIHDTGLSGYRDPSPYTHSSSSSEPGTSPRAFSSPLTPPSNVSLPLSVSVKTEPSVTPTSATAPPTLVPLSYLQGLQGRPRDPMDELYLKRFSTPEASSNHRLSWNGGPAAYDRYANEEAKPALVQHGGARW